MRELSQNAIDAGIGSLKLELIDEAPTCELTAASLMDLRTLRHVENNKALKALSPELPFKHSHNRDGYYINGEQVISYTDVSGPGPYKQVLALNYLEGVQ